MKEDFVSVLKRPSFSKQSRKKVLLKIWLFYTVKLGYYEPWSIFGENQ